MNADIHIYFLFLNRYHYLIANYGKKKVKKISYKGTTLDTTFDTELEEGKIKTEVVFLVGYLFVF